jgi:hypothetical protein
MTLESDIKRVYVAGKLNGQACDYIKNLNKMIKSSDRVRKAGFSVFIPGIDFLCGLTMGDWDYEHYFQNSQPWLAVSDAVFVQGRNWRTSKGTKREIASAEKLGIPVFHNLKKMKTYFSKLKKDKNKQIINQIREKCDSELTDIVGGTMNLYELNEELVNMMVHRSPEYIAILIEKRKDLKKYHSTIYITHEDFKKYK